MLVEIENARRTLAENSPLPADLLRGSLAILPINAITIPASPSGATRKGRAMNMRMNVASPVARA